MSDESDGEIDRGRLARFVHRNPDWYDEQPSDCVVCGRESVPVSWDGVILDRPDGKPATLHFDAPSCLSCRVDAAEYHMTTHPDQFTLSSFEEGSADA